MNERRLSRNPVRLAKDLRKDFSASEERPVDLDRMIEEMGIHYREARLPDGYLGASKTDGIKKVIIISNQIDGYGRKRFTIAHELGHIFLHQGSHTCRKCFFDLLYNKSLKESEANMFASELLVPGSIVRKLSRDEDITVELAKQVSGTYRTSLQSALIGLIKASPNIVYACGYTREKILWQIKSATDCELELFTKSRWPSDATAGKKKVKPESWFIDDDFPDDISCYEENYIYPGGAHCISIITVESEEW